MPSERSTKQISIDARLYDSIKDYCSLNGLKMKDYVQDLIAMSFNVDRYGESPFDRFNKKVTAQILETEKKEIEAPVSNPVDVSEIIFNDGEKIEINFPTDENGRIIGTDMDDDGTLAGEPGPQGISYENDNDVKKPALKNRTRKTKL